MLKNQSSKAATASNMDVQVTEGEQEVQETGNVPKDADLRIEHQWEGT